MKILVIIFFLAFATKGQTQLRCIVCTDCTNASENPSLICSQIDPPIEPSTTETEDTEESGPTENPTSETADITEIEVTTPSEDASGSEYSSITDDTTITTAAPITVDTSARPTPPPPPISSSINPNHDTFYSVLRPRRSAVQEAAANHRCFRYVYSISNIQRINRGCIGLQTPDIATCNSVSVEGGTTVSCDICSTDNCNSATSIAISTLAIFFSVFVGFQML